jgi:hypothetical protein
MEKRKVFAFALCAALSAVCAATSFAQVTVSGGFAISSVKDIKVVGGGNPSIDSETGIGGNLFVDYLLPISIPLSLGFELGVDGAKFTIENDGEESMTAIPLLLRAAWHFDLLPKLDLYLVGKIGYVIGVWEGDVKDELEKYYSIDDVGGVGFGFDLGVAYYPSSKFGVFAEVGFDEYALETKITGGGDSLTLKAPFNRFLTFGISGKF